MSLTSCNLAHKHQYGSSWGKDGTHHWHTCEGANCSGISDKAEHTGGTATETEKAKCEVCGESYGSLKSHEHAYTVSKVDAKYLVSEADCDSKVIYKKSSDCGEAGTETFESGEVLGHNYADSWTSDKDKHWHVCKREGCEETTTKTPHSGGNASPTKKATCEDCDQEYGDFQTAAATFKFGDDALDASLTASGKHTNGSRSAVTEYSESNNGYTLELNEPYAVYKSVKDDKGFGCLKFEKKRRGWNLFVHSL